MPPKKQKPADKVDAKEHTESVSLKEKTNHDNNHAKDRQGTPEPVSSVPSKRKQDKSSEAGSEKAPRRSGRGKAKPEALEVLRFLLSPEALELCRSQDEIKDLNERGKIRTYADADFSPFEELVSAVVLSRPISHALGVRTIRTLFNDPYNFTSPKAILDAGDEKVLKALWDARTQHKDKTAEQVSLIAKVVTEKFADGNVTDTSLEGARKQAQNDMDKESDLLTSNIKGLGKTGMSIFFRRIQWLWDECYPYVDDRTGKALAELGLPDDAEKLRKIMDEHWDDLKESVSSSEEEAVKKRKAFVVILERAVGAELEKNIEELVRRLDRS